MRISHFLLAAFVFLVVLVGLFPPRVKAADEFTKTATVQYVIDEDGAAQVNYILSLKNNMSTVYAREYVLELNSTDVNNVQVQTSENKPLPFTTSQGTNSTTIHIVFPDSVQAIGRDKVQSFKLNYTSHDLTQTDGKVLEISIPKLANPSDFSQYQVSILIPSKFGKPSLVQPNQYQYDVAPNGGIIQFNNVGKESGISLLFGDSQTYDLALKYHIENTSQNVGVVQVALPPDTAYQRMAYQKIDPQPENLTIDDDGNWIAEFRLAGQAQKEIDVQVQSTIFAQPQTEIGNLNPLKTNETHWWQKTASNPYLAASNYWQVQDPTIQKIAKDNNDPRRIYDYVVDTLQYNYSRLSQPDAQARLGASGALQDPANAICQEFTDVFVAIARAANIPARRITGYALTQNNKLRPLSLVSDVLHAWPEYFDTQKGIWQPVDPTWADTTGGVDYFSKLDLRHIVFAINGRDDTRPLPVGLYKLADSSAKDIQVTVAKDIQPLTPTFTLEKQPSLLPHIGFPTKETFKLKNTSGVAAYNIKIAYGLQGSVDLLTPATEEIPVLLPYSEQDLKVELTGHNWLQPDRAQLTVYVNDQSYEFETSAQRALPIEPSYFGVAVGGVVALLSLGTGCVLVLVARRHRHVRR